MDAKFKDVEAAFSRIKRRYSGGEISQREYIDKLKKLRIRDEEGRYWMIGPQSGKWYYCEGRDWVQSSPPSTKKKKSICIYCGYENDLETAVCAGCGGRYGEVKKDEEPEVCPECGSEIDPETDACPYCAARELESANDGEKPGVQRDDPGVACIVRSVRPLSFLWFSGGVGTVVGVLLGLLAGATNFFPGLTENLPAFFKDIQGRLVGGVIFAGLGGFFGFLVSSIAGFLSALAANAVLSFIGGLKVRIELPRGKN